MNKKTIMLTVVLMLSIFISACTSYKYTPNETGLTGNVVEEIQIEETNVTAKETEEVEEETEIEKTEETEKIELEDTRHPEEWMTKADIIGYEGDLIDLKPYVYDPDDDEVDLGFTAPFDKEGMWQTNEGDAGFYSVIVTATDNKDSFVTKQVKVLLLVRNNAPVFGIDNVVEFNEGERIVIDPDIKDEDGDEVVVLYSGWMSSRAYQSTYDDAGEYEVTMTADDGFVRVNKTVTVIVNDVNRKPTLELEESRITVTEEEVAEIRYVVEDPEEDELTINFGAPFDENGIWETVKGDKGAYVIKVTASDGINEVEQEVLVEVLHKLSLIHI